MGHRIEVAAVSKRFGAVVALDRVSLTIEPGERVAFVGANGSGKSTLLRAIMGLVRVEGRVRIGGVDVAQEPQDALAEVAYIAQIAPPLDAPVIELVRAVAALRGTTVEHCAKLVEQLGVSWRQVENVRMRDLSGGMKQKLLAALALASHAPILVCDEPTANLDAQARKVFFELVAQRPANSTLVLCSHRREEVRQLVDRVVELRDGKVVRDGKAREVLDAGDEALWLASEADAATQAVRA